MTVLNILCAVLGFGVAAFYGNRSAKQIAGPITAVAQWSEKLSLGANQIDVCTVSSLASSVELFSSFTAEACLAAVSANIWLAPAMCWEKGFSVVASEVRVLALKSADAANESKQLIEATMRAARDGSQTSAEASPPPTSPAVPSSDCCPACPAGWTARALPPSWSRWHSAP